MLYGNRSRLTVSVPHVSVRGAGCRICVGSVRSSGVSNGVYLLFRTLLPLNFLA